MWVLDTILSDKIGAAGERRLARPRGARGLAHVDERLAQVVEMRYFGGLSEAEISETLGLTERTVRRDWEKARLLVVCRAQVAAAMGRRQRVRRMSAFPTPMR
jgi:DNA-directed RNA polymerase specialized sigma24 family protein